MQRTLQILFLVTGAIGLISAAASGSMFTGFDQNPADSALTAKKDMRIDTNPAEQARNAVPWAQDRPRINQRSTVTANASTATNTSANVTQRTDTHIADRLTYRADRNFDNVFLNQEAVSRIRQDCRTRGSCKQDANSNISQEADIQIDSRFTNVFLTQKADSYIDQNCRSGSDCRQAADARINQDANVDGHWSSNGFVSADRNRALRQRSYRPSRTR